MKSTKVAVKVCKQYDIPSVSKVISEGLDLLGGIQSIIKPNSKVLIKPDLYFCTHPNEAKTTHPNIVGAIAEVFERAGAKCIIADSPKGELNSSRLDRAYIKTQMLEASNNGHAILNTNVNVTTIYNANGERCKDIAVMDAVNDVDFIVNVGKLRCDQKYGLMGCVHNLFGLVPGRVKDLVHARLLTYKDYFNYDIDLHEALDNKVVLNVLDAIVGCEANGDPRILNTIFMGLNPYAVDSAALKLINQDPNQSLALQEAKRRGFFDFTESFVGDSIDPLVLADFNYTSAEDGVKAGSLRAYRTKYNRTVKRPSIAAKQCKGCRACVNSCPMGAISMKTSNLGEYAAIDYGKCINCFKCLNACPYKVAAAKTPRKYKRMEETVRKNFSKKD